MSKVQTDNSYFFDKVMLRVNHLPAKKELKVLDCYAGSSLIWNYIISTIDKKMVRKVPTLFTKNGLDKFKQFLAQNGISKIYVRSTGKKNYIAFQVEK